MVNFIHASSRSSARSPIDSRKGNDKERKVDWHNLPNEMLLHIFRFLQSNKDIARASMVCRNWKVLIDGDPLLQFRLWELFNLGFGKDCWLKYFGDVGVVPPLPDNIHTILDSPCIFWPEKKVRETHLLVLIPNTVDGKPFHLNALAELIRNPKEGFKTQYSFYEYDVKRALGAQSQPSHWALMTRDVIPGSRNKIYDDQRTLVQSRALESGIPYELPTTLEAATAILLEYVQTGIRLYANNPSTYMRCPEWVRVRKHKFPVVIGDSTGAGLYISLHFEYGRGYVDQCVGGLRKFM